MSAEPRDEDGALFAARAQAASLVLALLLLAALALGLAFRQLVPLALAGPLGLALLVLRLRAFGSRVSSLPNLITAVRVALTGSMALGAWGSEPLPYALLVLVIFILDGVDGRLARRFHASSRQGSHFDMEADGYLVLVLCALLCLHEVGGWVLIGGLLRYAYVIATWLFPSRGEAPPSRFGRYAFSLSLAAFSVALLAEPPFAKALALLGTSVLVWSFGRSFYWAFRGAAASAARA
jgi:phosphatidylglycerophosphate synthase